MPLRELAREALDGCESFGAAVLNEPARSCFIVRSFAQEPLNHARGDVLVTRLLADPQTRYCRRIEALLDAPFGMNEHRLAEV